MKRLAQKLEDNVQTVIGYIVIDTSLSMEWDCDECGAVNCCDSDAQGEVVTCSECGSEAYIEKTQ